MQWQRTWLAADTRKDGHRRYGHVPSPSPMEQDIESQRCASLEWPMFPYSIASCLPPHLAYLQCSHVLMFINITSCCRLCGPHMLPCFRLFISCCGKHRAPRKAHGTRPIDLHINLLSFSLRSYLFGLTLQCADGRQRACARWRAERGRSWMRRMDQCEVMLRDGTLHPG